MIRLIVGLGNPGKDYTKTRHNAGAWLIEKLCQDHDLTLRVKTSFYGQYASVKLTESLNLHTLIPITFMNQSGNAVGAITRYYKISPQEILVVHDELDFPAGIARLKLGGGIGGHNGLRDIVRACGNNHFWRLRIGIGHPGDKLLVPNYVLNVPSQVEYAKIQKTIQASLNVLPDLCVGRAEQAMHVLHSDDSQ